NVRTGAIRSLDAADALYAGLAWRAHSEDLAAMRGRVDSAFVDTNYAVIAWKHLGSAEYTKSSFDPSTAGSGPAAIRGAAYRPPQWSEDGGTLVFGVAPREPKATPDRRAPGELPPARVQVWHWKDVRQFHQQEVNAAQDRQRTTPVAWKVGSSAVVHLSDDPLEVVSLSDNGSA